MDAGEFLERTGRLYRRLIDPADNAVLPSPLRAAWRWIRVFYEALRHDRAFERAGALAYGTLVSLVPMLMLVFAVLHASGLLEQGSAVESLVFGTFLGDIPEVRDLLLPGLREVNLGAIGVLGTAGWLWVSARIYMTMENAYSEMWRVPVKRGFGRRMLNFYLALTAGPVLLGTALFGSIELAEHFGVQWWGDALAVAVPMLLLTLAIKLLPSTEVRWAPAVIGGVLSGVLVEGGAWAFGMYVQTFASRDPIQVVYGSIGLIPVFLLWLYFVWVFVLLGVEVAHVAQDFPSLVRAEHEAEREQSDMVRVPSVDNAIEIAAAVAWYFKRGECPVSEHRIARRCRFPEHRIATVLQCLEQARIVIRAGDGWVVARPPADIELRDVVDGWRTATQLRVVDDDPVSLRFAQALREPFTGTLETIACDWLEPEPPDA